jgi:IS5 family transposase
MAERRFKVQGENSWYGRMVYDRIISKDHFLRVLLGAIPWERFTYKLVKWYKGNAREGRPPYDPSVILRMLLLAYLYNLSERQVESTVNDTLSMKFFLGLAVDEVAPDHSTLSAFRARIIANGREEKLQELLADIVQIAKEKGIEFGTIQVLDSVHTVADVNPAKDDRRQEKGGQPPRDADAQWGVKGRHRVRGVNGELVEVRETFYGFKAHCSLNSSTELITSIEVTAGNAYDGHLLPKLVESDLGQGLPVKIVSADRGYDDSDNHILLWSRGIHSGIRLNDYRTEKKDRNTEVWEALKQEPEYALAGAVRHRVERKFGEAKEGHGLRRCRYVGLVKYLFQAVLTAIALDLKRIVKLTTGVPFKAPAMAVT